MLTQLNGVSQYANFVKDGGFEDLKHCDPAPGFNRMKYWTGIDTNKFRFNVLNKCLSNVPNYGPEFQNPKNGAGFVVGTFLCVNCNTVTNRSYFRNTLKGGLLYGKTYCVKFYVNVRNSSPYAIDEIGAYFGGNELDTIKYGDIVITYLIPQVTNPSGNIITDTLNWVPITGTFVATGNEKYLIIGNFKSDANTNKIKINNSTTDIWCDLFIDDVSCIDINLPAYAGPDHFLIPGDSAFVGREPDVGIDEACMWYLLPNDSVPIDTVAGLWVKPVGTATYVVRQQLHCSGVKWDTVVVYENPLGIHSLFISAEGLKVYPNPAGEILKLELRLLPDANLEDHVFDIMIYNNLGQVVKFEEITFKENGADIKTDDLPEGVYSLKLKGTGGLISKRFMIAR